MVLNGTGLSALVALGLGLLFFIPRSLENLVLRAPV